HRARLAEVGADLVLRPAAAFHRLAVDGEDAIAGAEPGLGGRRLWLDVPDAGGEVLVGRREDHEVEDDGEDEVRRRPGEGDQRLLPGRLLEKPTAAVLGGDLLVRVIAGELDVTAQRKERNPVFRLLALEPEQLGPEADGE